MTLTVQVLSARFVTGTEDDSITATADAGGHYNITLEWKCVYTMNLPSAKLHLHILRFPGSIGLVVTINGRSWSCSLISITISLKKERLLYADDDSFNPDRITVKQACT